MNKFFTKIAGLTLGLAMAIGVGVAVGSKSSDVKRADAAGEETLTFNSSSYPWGTGGYGDSQSAANHKTSGSTNIAINWKQTYKVNDGIQMKKSGAGYFWSSTTISTKYISSITITNDTNSANIQMSTNGSTWSSSTTYTSGTAKTFSDELGYKYFKIITGSSYCILTSVVVTYSTIPAKTLDAVSGITATVTAKQGASNWTVTNFTATGTISGTANQNVTNYVDYTVNTAVPSTTQASYTVQFTVSKKSDKSGTFTSANFNITNATVTADPFLSYSLVTSIDSVNSQTLYALGSEDKEVFAKNSISSSQIATNTANSDIGLFRLVPSGTNNKFYLQFITGSSFPYTGGNFINNSDKTSLVSGASGSSKWVLTDGTGKVYLQNSDNNNRHLGLGIINNATVVKAYADTSSNAPVYLYSIATDSLQSIACVSNTTSFGIGDSFSFGGTVTATYSISGITGHSGITSGLSFKFKAIGGSSFGDMPETFNLSHNGGTVQVTYTDAWGSVVSTTYTITVAYETITELTLNSGSTLTLLKEDSYTFVATPNEGADPSVTWSATSEDLTENYDFSIGSSTGVFEVDTDITDNATVIVTATSNADDSVSATCTVTIAANPVLKIFENSIDVTEKSLTNRHTGDELIYLSASAANFEGAITYTWSSSNTSAIAISEAADELCAFEILGAGNNIELSCHAVGADSGDLTVKTTVSVIQSEVTSLTLSSSVSGGVLYDKTFGNTLDLTPTITKVGNATSVINWVSSDTSVATVSSSQTDGAAITVTAVTDGGSAEGKTTTITARSAYTSSVYAEYTVTVKKDDIDTISWTGTSATQMTGIAGVAQLTAATVNTSWSVSATWKSGKVDSNLKFADYTLKIGTKTITSLPYTFAAEDNGQDVTITYNGFTRKTGTKPSIIESLNDISATTTGSSKTATYTATDGGAMTSSTTGSISDTQSNNWSFEVANYSQYTGSDKTYYQFGSNKLGDGSLSLSISNIGVVSSISVYCASSNGHTLTVQVGDTKYFDSQALEGLNDSYTRTYSVSNKSSSGDISISISGGTKGMYFKGFSITYAPQTTTYYSNQDYITQKAVLDFVATFDNSLKNICVMDGSTSTSDLSTAWEALSTAFTNARNGLTADTSMTKAERQTLFDNIFKNAVKSERDSSGLTPLGDSLQKALAKYDWILHSHGSLDDFIKTTTGRKAANTAINLFAAVSKNTSSTIIIVVISAISVAAIGGYFLFRKKKDN